MCVFQPHSPGFVCTKSRYFPTRTDVKLDVRESGEIRVVYYLALFNCTSLKQITEIVQVV